ncbi:hypothetical protein Tco_0269677 [Tanacetum coccineum]
MLSSSNWLFFFQFSSKDGLDAMLENGPCVPMSACTEDGLSIIATKLGTPLMLDSYTPNMCMQSLGRSSYAGAMIELRVDKELKNTIVVAMPKLVGEGHVLDEFPKKIISDVVKNSNTPRQATRDVPVGLKVSFKSTKQIYKHVSNKNGASTSGKKKQAEVARQEVINSNPFEALNLIENDDDLGKLLLVDDDEKPLPKVVSTTNANSDSEVDEVFDEHATFMVSTGLKRGSDIGYGTNNLWEQWKETKQDDDYDSYDDDLYDSHDMSEAICD